MNASRAAALALVGWYLPVALSSTILTACSSRPMPASQPPFVGPATTKAPLKVVVLDDPNYRLRFSPDRIVPMNPGLATTVAAGLSRDFRSVTLVNNEDQSGDADLIAIPSVEAHGWFTENRKILLEVKFLEARDHSQVQDFTASRLFDLPLYDAKTGEWINRDSGAGLAILLMPLSPILLPLYYHYTNPAAAQDTSNAIGNLTVDIADQIRRSSLMTYSPSGRTDLISAAVPK